MNNLQDLSPLNREMPLCIADLATEEERKRGVHDIKTFQTYPPYPWAFTKEADHSQDNPKVFCDIARQSGIMRDLRAEDKRVDDRPISYEQWLERHENEPGWVNNLESVLK